MKKKYVNYCLDCGTRNCYNRSLGPKGEHCLEIDYKKEIALNAGERKQISRTNAAIKGALTQKPDKAFALRWLTGFVKNFFGTHDTVGIACCLGATHHAKTIAGAFEKEGITCAVVTCKLGGLTIDTVNKKGEPYAHPGCNPIAQAKIINKLNVPVVVLVSLCIGHDMLFIKHCTSYVIPFMTKVPVGFGGM